MLKKFLTDNYNDNGEIFAKFDEFRVFLQEYNQKVNLTAVTDTQEIYVKHFIDSLLGDEFIKKNATVLDIGSGAGLPAIPLCIVRDDINILMTDSVNKKIIFLNEAIKLLKLSNIEARHTRIEEIKQKESFDCVTSRAVAPLKVLAEYSLPFCKIGGIMLCFKAGNVDDEVKDAENAINILGGKIDRVVKKQLDNDTERSFVIIKKVKSSSSKYPRGKNLPRTAPL